MKIIFTKNRVTFQTGNGMVKVADSKLLELYIDAMKERSIEPTLPIYYGNERTHSGVFANV